MKFKRGQFRKAQFSHGDFIIGFIIFAVALLLFYKYSPLLTDNNQHNGNEDILIEGRLITDSLLAEGYPSNWTTGNVINIGLTDGTSAIDNSKLDKFLSMDYTETKNTFKTRYDYYFYFTHDNDSIILINGTEGKGYPGVNLSNIGSIKTEKLTKITRLARYDSEIVKMVLLLW